MKFPQPIALIFMIYFVCLEELSTLFLYIKTSTFLMPLKCNVQYLNEQTYYLLSNLIPRFLFSKQGFLIKYFSMEVFEYYLAFFKQKTHKCSIFPYY